MEKTRLQVRPLPSRSPITYEVRYDVWTLRGVREWAAIVDYQPSDGWKPELAMCSVGCLQPCEHVAAVVEFRRRGEG